jgi:hypothetical protein
VASNVGFCPGTSSGSGEAVAVVIEITVTNETTVSLQLSGVRYVAMVAIEGPINVSTTVLVTSPVILTAEVAKHCPFSLTSYRVPDWSSSERSFEKVTSVEVGMMVVYISLCVMVRVVICMVFSASVEK